MQAVKPPFGGGFANSFGQDYALLMAIIHSVLSSKPYQSIRVALDEVMTLGPATIGADDVVLQQGWTLHELDFSNNRVVFLQTGASNQLFTAPFSYQAQVTSAQQAAFINFDDFLKLSEQLDLPQHLIHLFNIGHCGSTLLHQVFNASGAAQCISEPKFSFDLATYRDKAEPPMLAALSAACLKFLTLLPGYDPSQPLVLKHFSQACRIIETWAAASPNATNLFLYRDAISYANSRYGFVQRRGLVADFTPENKLQRWHTASVGKPEAYLEGIIDINATELRFDEFVAVAWALFMQDYTRAKANGIKLHPFRYNELVADRSKQMAAIFKVCNLPADQLAAALVGFDKPSHEGTSSDRSKPARKLPTDSGERITRILSHTKLALDPNLIL